MDPCGGGGGGADACPSIAAPEFEVNDAVR